MKMKTTHRVVRMKIVRLTLDFTQQELATLQGNLHTILDRTTYTVNPLTRALETAVSQAHQLSLDPTYRVRETAHVVEPKTGTTV